MPPCYRLKLCQLRLYAFAAFLRWRYNLLLVRETCYWSKGSNQGYNCTGSSRESLCPLLFSFSAGPVRWNVRSMQCLPNRKYLTWTIWDIVISTSVSTYGRRQSTPPTWHHSRESPPSHPFWSYDTTVWSSHRHRRRPLPPPSSCGRCVKTGTFVIGFEDLTTGDHWHCQRGSTWKFFVVNGRSYTTVVTV